MELAQTFADRGHGESGERNEWWVMSSRVEMSKSKKNKRRKNRNWKTRGLMSASMMNFRDAGGKEVK